MHDKAGDCPSNHLWVSLLLVPLHAILFILYNTAKGQTLKIQIVSLFLFGENLQPLFPLEVALPLDTSQRHDKLREEKIIYSNDVIDTDGWSLQRLFSWRAADPDPSDCHSVTCKTQISFCQNSVTFKKNPSSQTQLTASISQACTRSDDS